MNENIKDFVPDVSDEGTENITEKKKQERMFTQKELEEKISERLSRERRINESLSSVKQLLKSFSQKGLISSTSYADMAKELIDKLKGEKTAQTEGETADVKETLPSVTSAVADADGKTDTFIGDGKNYEERENAERFVEVISKIKAKYPDGAVTKMLSGDMFESFARGRSGSLEEIFDDYYEFVRYFGGEEKWEAPSDLSSTAFSSHSGSVRQTSLTSQQMEIAKSAGMSYREYSELLESIPKRGQRIRI